LDLHLTDARATAEERAAVDSELSGLESDWQRNKLQTAETQTGIDNLGRGLRHKLLPVLHAVQARVGWISHGALNYVAARLNIAPAEVYGVASFYGMLSLRPQPPVVAHVCDDIACFTHGSDKLCGELELQLGPAGSPCIGGRATWFRSQCLGLCERGPAALIISAGERPYQQVLAPVSAESIQQALSDVAANNKSDSFTSEASVPQSAQSPLGSNQFRLLRRINSGASSSLKDYLSTGGYEGLRRAWQLGPEGVLREISASKLLGRGGAAFPTARKWEALFLQRLLLAQDPNRAHYLICNADESEPGTFKDRILMEADPFAVLEGMTIAAFVTGARHGFIYVRGEYPLATERMQQAIQSAGENGFLGDNILGSGQQFNVEVRRGAGAYICGEETALFNSIEGYRGEPRNKPPFPTESGLFRQPTVVNNVETLVNVPYILREGGAIFAASGTEVSAGTRLFCLSGHVARPGAYEVVMGTTLRTLIQTAGGVSGSGKLQAVLLGGAAGSFVSPRELDMPLTFEGARAIGATLGSGVVMLFDDTIDLRLVLLRIASFFRHETCGQCVPCRVGVVRQQEALERLVKANSIGSVQGELKLLSEIGQAMRDASICGLGQTAASALESALQRWSLFS
jgi:NADH-quinone oxidoreductase subunit F